MLLRINQFLVRAGLGSRRKNESLVLDGKISVNGNLCLDLSTKIDTEVDEVIYQGKNLSPLKKQVYYAFNKSRGLVCTQHDPFYSAEELISHYFRSIPEHIFSIGRLDKESRGLILLTNDGDLSHFLAHPKYKVQKTYIVLIRGYLTTDNCETLLNGVDLDEGTAKFAELKILVASRDKSRLKVVLEQGWNRQIRRMIQSIGKSVIDIQRVQFGPIKLGRLKENEYKALSLEEITVLKSDYNQSLCRLP